MGKTSEGVTLGKLITDSKFKKILNSVMPGGNNWHKNNKDCFATCPNYKKTCCSGPDKTLCTDHWAESKANFKNLSVLCHVMDNFDYYDCGDLNGSLRRKTIDQLRAFVHELLDSWSPSNQMRPEGAMKLVTHIRYERNQTLIKAKKDGAGDKPQCEICRVYLTDRYGDIAAGFIECHHKTPLYKDKKQHSSTIGDLILVCPNCHRMLHRLITNEGLSGEKAIKTLKKRLVNA